MLAPWCPKPSKKTTGSSCTLTRSRGLPAATCATLASKTSCILPTTSPRTSKVGRMSGMECSRSQKSRRWMFTMPLSTSCELGTRTGSPSSRWIFVLIQLIFTTLPLTLPSRLRISSPSQKDWFTKISAPAMTFCTTFLAASEKARPPMPSGPMTASTVESGRPSSRSQAKKAPASATAWTPQSTSRRSTLLVCEPTAGAPMRCASSRCRPRR
mmetsp:Transcript_30033/g.95885  ORF Transcript_30033/g.95885 Transcript_30033/m.95885 type:complete len:213 (-) Transcript_30033:686-1324(-)